MVTTRSKAGQGQRKESAIFHLWSRLPTELQFAIVELACASIPRSGECAKFLLPRYASINSVWQEVVERQTFNHLKLTRSQLPLFKKTCSGRRLHLLKQLEFNVDARTRTKGAVAQTIIQESFSELFSTLKAFKSSHPDEPQSFDLRYTIRANGRDTLGVDRYKFHVVDLPVITAIRSLDVGASRVALDPVSVGTMLSCLPSLVKCKMHFELGQLSEKGVLDTIAIIRILQDQQATRCPALKDCTFMTSEPYLMCWTLGPHGERAAAEAFGTALKSLTSIILTLSQGLTELRLDHVVDVEHFFSGVSREHPTTKCMWPSLRALVVLGSFKGDPRDERIRGRLLNTVSRCLTHMPKIVQLEVNMGIAEERKYHIRLELGEGNEKELRVTGPSGRLPPF